MNKLLMLRQYVERGWELVPVDPAIPGEKNSGKRPTCAGWNRGGVTSEEDIEKYWGEGSGNRNVGILTGEKSKLVVLDIDNPEAFQRVLEKHPEMKDTYIVGRSNADPGRWHYYFKLPQGMQAPSNKAIASTGWGDLLSTGKQVVAPPSIHYTGADYQVLNDVAPLPFKEEYMSTLLIEKEINGIPDRLREKVRIGAHEGERNVAAFEISCDLRDHNVQMNTAESLIKTFCDNCTPPYSHEEGIITLNSAYSKKLAQKRYLNSFNYRVAKKTDENGEVQETVQPLKPEDVINKLVNLLSGHVVKVQNDLMVLPKDYDGAFHVLKNEVDLFSHLGFIYNENIDWRTGTRFMRKEEAFSTLKRELPLFDSIETVPHYPLMTGCYYYHPDLPLPHYEIMDRFIGFFSPETEHDRSLIVAILMTVLWGGLPGQRAPFVITSKNGRGVGKSTLAEIPATLINQNPVQANTRDEAKTLVTRLLSPEAMNKRMVMFDNEDGSSRVSNGELAGIFTMECISGHKLYAAEAHRKNTFTWVITLNAPNFDSDFACRCIPISLSRPVCSATWKDDISEFIKEHRWTLIATFIDCLKKAPAEFKTISRWAAWEYGVLARVPGINLKEVQDLIVSKQMDYNSEENENEMIIHEVNNCIERSVDSPDRKRIFISNKFMVELVRNALNVGLGNNNALMKITALIDSQRIPNLCVVRRSDCRGFYWKGANKAGSGVDFFLNLDCEK